MKITCESCGSKYTIADTKVDGRKVKVRCKNCKAMIIVDGSGEGAADVADVAPKKDAWSVNLTDDDSREMTTSELVAGWKSGLVTTDAYVWKDGMDDWKPVLEVPELKKQLLAAKPLKDDGVVSSASAGGGATDDLFGGPGGPAVPAPGAGGDDKKATGARNESSVLFSLDALKGGPKDAPKAAAPSIDVFGNLGSTPLLTNNADLLTAPAKDPPPAPAGARIQAPIASAPSKGKGGLIAAILGGALIIGGGLFFALKSGDEPAVDPAATAEAEKLKAEAAAATKKAEEALKKAEEQQKAMMAELQKAKDEAQKRGEDPAEAERKKKEELEKQEAEAKAKTATTTPTTSTGSASTGSTTAAKPAETKPAATSGGAAFDVGAAKAALSAAAANAAGCGKPGGPTGTGKVQVTFAPSGRVTSAEVISGPFGGTAVGGCVATKFRAARVPAFSGSPQTAAKSFTIN